jgi:hypothetical protein
MRDTQGDSTFLTHLTSLTVLLAASVLAAGCGGAGPHPAATPSGEVPAEATETPNVGAGPLVAITFGFDHACALGAAGEVFCWGENRSFQLGHDRASLESTRSPAAERVALPLAARSVAAGWFHTCALLVDGSVYCWGENHVGQVARRTSGADPRPFRVPHLEPIAELQAMRSLTCTRSTTGVVSCFGELPYSGDREGTQIEPFEIVPLRGASRLVLARTDLCGEFETGELRCERSGQVLPQISGVASLSEAACDGHDCCAATPGGGVTCRGMLACGDSDEECDVPFDGHATAVRGSSDAFCVLGAEGGVECNRFQPPGLFVRGGRDWAYIDVAGAEQLAVGQRGACALVGGEPYCWSLPVSRPLHREQVYTLPGPIDEVALGATLLCVRRGASVDCWEGAVHGSGAFPPSAARRRSTTARSIAAGDRHACALDADGRVSCWGANAAGQLGDGTTTERDASAYVEGLSNVQAIAAAGDATCALNSSATVSCWGHHVPAPAPLASLAGVTALALTPTAQCFVGASAELVCRGLREPQGTGALGPPGWIDPVSYVRGGGAILAVSRAGSIAAYQRVSSEAGHLFSAGSLTLAPTVRDVRARSIDVCTLLVSGTAACNRELIAEDAEALFTGGDMACALRRGGDVACVGPPPGDRASRTLPVEHVRGPWAAATLQAVPAAVGVEGRAPTSEHRAP